MHQWYLILDVIFVMIIKEWEASDLCGSSEWAAADVDYGDVHRWYCSSSNRLAISEEKLVANLMHMIKLMCNLLSATDT